MTEPRKRQQPPVVLQRRLAADPGTVYEAWTTPEVVRHWLHPGPEWTTPISEIDLRVGGNYRIGFQHVDETDISYVVGEYREVDPNKRLVYTWTWLPPDPHAGRLTLVTVTFEPDGEGTVLLVRHEHLPDEPARQRHELGWADTLNLFEQVLQNR